MPKKKIVKGKHWYIRCGWKACSKRFKPKREHAKYCCPSHRISDWNENHPRISKEDFKKLQKK